MNSDEVDKVIEQLLNSYNPQETGIFISLLSHRYMKMCNITKEQFMTSLSNSIDNLENGEK
ncbi:MAG: hypothetical protein ILA19_01540 [Bacilli bacterium]|nr:hypothetical protein [Bacilli bacterium]